MPFVAFRPSDDALPKAKPSPLKTPPSTDSAAYTLTPSPPAASSKSKTKTNSASYSGDYVATNIPQHRDELDLLTEGVYAKWRQQRLWMAETAQIETELRKALPMANANAHLANGIAKSEAVLKLYLRYDAQLHRHFRHCLKDLRDLQAQRLPLDDAPSEPKLPLTETESPAATFVEATIETSKEPMLTPEQARLKYMQSEIKPGNTPQQT